MKAKPDFRILNTDRIASTNPGSTARQFAPGNPRASARHPGTRAGRANTLAWLGLLCGACLFNTHAADLVWTNAAGGAWSTASNWSPNQVPTAGDRVWITNSGTYRVTVSGGGAAGELALGGASGVQTLSLMSGTFVVGSGAGNTNSVLSISGGTLGGGGGVVLAGALNWTGGSITNTVRCAGGSIGSSATKTLRQGGLVNTGVLTFSGGYLELYDGATVSNLASATFDITADCDISYYAGNEGLFYNAGLLRKSGGTALALVGARVYNDTSGVISAEIGTLRLRGGGTYHGTATTGGNGTLSFYGGIHEFAPDAVLGGGGTLECSGSAVLNLSPPSTVAVLSMNGGSLTASGTLTANRLVWTTGTIEGAIRCLGGEIRSSSTNPPKLRGGCLINSGLLTAGLIVTEEGATITNLSTGILDFTNSTAGIRHEAGAYGTFHNAGLVRGARPGSVSCSIGEPFYNTGAVESQDGGIRFARSFLQTAGETRAEAGPIIAEQGLTLMGGVLAGTNVVRGNVTNNAAISPGAPRGLLTIAGTYVEQPNARVRIEVGGPVAGTEHDQLVVTNVARLAGTLEVVRVNGFLPGAGVVITALVCNARSGTFGSVLMPEEYYVLYMPKTVLLETDNAPPTPRLEVNPTQVACHPFELRGAATDPDGTVTNLTFLVEGAAVGQFPNQTAGKVLACLDFPGQVLCTLQAADDRGAMGETNILVTITTLPVRRLDAVGFQTNRAFKLCMCGETGSNYVIEATADLPPSNWSALGTMENTNGIWRFFDTTATNAPRRFYRARQL
jgi:hypothetical protein